MRACCHSCYWCCRNPRLPLIANSTPTQQYQATSATQTVLQKYNPCVSWFDHTYPSAILVPYAGDNLPQRAATCNAQNLCWLLHPEQQLLSVYSQKIPSWCLTALAFSSFLHSMPWHACAATSDVHSIYWMTSPTMSEQSKDGRRSTRSLIGIYSAHDRGSDY